MSAPAIHTVLLLDTSSSIRQRGLGAAVIDAANVALAQLRAAESLVSVVYFNTDLGTRVWRVPARDFEGFDEFNMPFDGGTRLFDVVVESIRRLVAEFDASLGETNADVNILLFTDGEDTKSRATLMDARLALGEARRRGWRITFVAAAVPGLAADLGLGREETMDVRLSAADITNGFREATKFVDPAFIREHIRKQEEELAKKAAEEREREERAREERVRRAHEADEAKMRRPWWKIWGRRPRR